MKRVANTRRVYRQELLGLKTILELLSSWASPEGIPHGELELAVILNYEAPG